MNQHLLFDEDGEIRGLRQADSYGSQWRYYLTLYANIEDEDITFRFYNSDDNINVPVSDTITFVNNSGVSSKGAFH